METTKIRYIGFVFLHDGVLLLFDEVPAELPHASVVYEAHPGNLRSIRIGPLEATVTADVFKHLLANPRIYVGVVGGGEDLLVGSVAFVIENLDKDAIFEVL